MIDNRHCHQDDLFLFDEEVKRIKNQIIEEKTIDLREFLTFIARFDKDISMKLELLIKSEKDRDRLLRIIDRYCNELRQNIIVDIYEHH